MNPELLDHYKKELLHLREMGGEFAREYPKIASRLGLETLECSDPYVERLLEGFAFLAARVQLKLDSSHRKLAQHLLEIVYPNYLAPTPSMVVAEFTPSAFEGTPGLGFTVDRGTRLRSQLSPDTKTECDFRTSHQFTMWPIEVSAIKFLGSRAAIQAAGVKAGRTVHSGISVSLKALDGIAFSELAADELSFYICGSENSGVRLYEQLFKHTKNIEIVANGDVINAVGKPPRMSQQGFKDDEALLPVNSQSFQGNRLIQEYFAFPERFQFIKLENLKSRFAKSDSTEVELIFLFDVCDLDIEKMYSKENIKLNCVPAINLFPRVADRVHLSRKQHEYHIVPDRTRPLDYEIYSVDKVEGISGFAAAAQEFVPYYSVSEKRQEASSFYGVSREPRQLSSKQKQRGTKTSYLGSELFLSLVDINDAPYRSDLRQLSVKTHCTNRDLTLQMPVGAGTTDFYLDIGAPVEAIRCVAGPTRPRISSAGSRDVWNLVSNLSLNYLSISDLEDEKGSRSAAMLRQMLMPYIDGNSETEKRQLEGILSVTSKPLVKQRRNLGRLEIARGIQVTIHLDESAFEGTGAYLLGSVLERYFARYATVNSFTETVLTSVQRNQVEAWPMQIGQRSTL